MIYKNVTFGCDPEFFLTDLSGNAVSAIDKVGGTKHEPRRLKVAPGSVQEDNVAVEFNIDPVNNLESWLKSIRQTLNEIGKELGAKGLVPSLTHPSMLFPVSQLKHPKATEFGCEPDYNAWTKMENPKPVLQKGMETLRTAGGHIHVGYDSPDLDKGIALIKAMDIFLGVPSITLDKDTRRRLLYGKPGAFRPKEYGVEYRTLSNFWISDEIYQVWVFNQTQKALDYLNSGQHIDDEDYDKVDMAIMEGNMDSALDLVHKYGVV